MQVEVLLDAETVAKRAAAIIAEYTRRVFRACGCFILAVSGGHTLWLMLRMLGEEEAPWGGVLVLQVDERIAPPGDPDRNLTHLQETLLENAPINSSQIHPMPVEMADAQVGIATDHGGLL